MNICYIYENKLVCCFILKFEMLVAKAEDCNKNIFYSYTAVFAGSDMLAQSLRLWFLFHPFLEGELI